MSRSSLERALAAEDQPRSVHAFLPDVDPISSETPLHEVMRTVASTECPVPVVDGENKLVGSISPSSLLRTLDREG